MGVVTARVGRRRRRSSSARRRPTRRCSPRARCCGADQVLRVGGAHAVAALAYGTESIERVDVIAGPGNEWVQEAKRQVSGDVGIDGFLGPSDVLVLADGSDRPAAGRTRPARPGRARARDDRGRGRPTTRRWLDAIDLAGGADTGAVARARPRRATSTTRSRSPRRSPPSTSSSSAPAAEELAPRVHSAGLRVRRRARAATAFGDYVAGSNHSLPTGGSARFASGLSVAPLPPALQRGAHRRRARARSRWPESRSRGPRDSSCMRLRCAAGRMHRDEPQRRDRPRDQGDQRPPELTLDGTGAGTRDTGVGFLDHMLDLLARHGRMRPRRQGDRRPADRRPPHGRGHRARARPGARSRARRPRRHHPLRPRGRADGRGARDGDARHLRAPVLRVRRPTCRPAAPAASTTSWPRSSSARWPTAPS